MRDRRGEPINSTQSHARSLGAICALQMAQPAYVLWRTIIWSWPECKAWRVSLCYQAAEQKTEVLHVELHTCLTANARMPHLNWITKTLLIVCGVTQVESVATTLSLAEQNHAEELKRVCLEFVSRNLQAVMLSEGYQHMVNSCPQLQVTPSTCLHLNLPLSREGSFMPAPGSLQRGPACVPCDL